MKRIFVFLTLLLLSFQVWAGTRKAYVDPDAGGGETGVDWANAYTSLAAAIAGEVSNGADLVTEQNDLNIYFKSSSGSADTTQALFNNNFTANATYDIELIMDGTEGSDCHSGVWSDSLYRLSVSNAYALYIYSDDFITVRGLQIETPAIDGADHIVFTNGQVAGAILKFEQCIIRGADDGSNAQYGIQCVDADADVYISNCLIYDLNSTQACYGIAAAGDEVFIYNNTVVGGDRGIVDQAPASRGTVVKNNICIDQANYCFYTGGSWDANSCNNLSDDTTAPGDANVHSVEPTFANKAGFDFHLASNDSNAKDAGADLDSDPSGFYNITEDIDKEDRDDEGGGTWDIGADEYVAAGSTPIAAISMNHRRRR